MKRTVMTLLVLVFVTPAWASLQIDPSSVTSGDPIDIPTVNNFKDAFEAAPWGYTKLFNNGADILATADGTLNFFYHGAESGFTNAFVIDATGYNNATNEIVGGTILHTEAVGGFSTPAQQTFGNVTGGSDAGLPIGDAAGYGIANGQSFSDLGIGFIVSSTNSVNGTFPIEALAGMAGFGVFVKVPDGVDTTADPDWWNGQDFFEFFLGFDDNGAGPDDNHDDMIVRVTFTPNPDQTNNPVPEATSLLTWGGLMAVAGLFFSRRRRK